MSPAVQPAPWYRQFWPWFLIAIPASAVAAGVAMLMIALHAPDSLVVDDYYKEGLAINQALDRDAAAQRLGLAAEVQIGTGGAVRVVVQALQPVEPDRLVLHLVHPTRAERDRRIVLARGQDGAYHGTLEAVSPARWHVTLEPVEGPKDWRLTGRLVLPQEGRARLG